MMYLKRKQQEMDFSVIHFDNLKENLFTLLETGQKQSLISKVKPIIKWAGGKRSIMNNLLHLFPCKIEKDYHEPFCGGISVACELYNSGIFSHNTTIYLNDTISELIYLYEVVKEDPKLLIAELSKEQYIVTEENFEKNKVRYNEVSKNNTELLVEISALFLFLNKTGFNAVYRENQKGEYNVPFAKKTNVTLYEKDNLYTMIHFYRNVY
jgi:DNA adenine methylase